MTLAIAKPFAVAAWNLDEASGTRTDQVGSSNLTDNNSTGSTAGMFAAAADFVRANNTSLSISDNAALSSGNIKIYFRFWFRLTSDPGNPMYLLSKDDFNTEREYGVSYQGGLVKVYFSSDGLGESVAVNSNRAISTGIWYLLHAWHDPGAQEVGISVNADTPDTFTYSAGIRNGAASFFLGGMNFDPANAFDGEIDDVVVIKNRILTSAERTEDYAGGAGKKFADWAGVASGMGGLSIPYLPPYLVRKEPRPRPEPIHAQGRVNAPRPDVWARGRVRLGGHLSAALPLVPTGRGGVRQRGQASLSLPAGLVTALGQVDNGIADLKAEVRDAADLALLSFLRR